MVTGHNTELSKVMIFTVKKVDLFFPKFYSGKGIAIEFWKLNIARKFLNPVKCFNLVICVPVARRALVPTRTQRKITYIRAAVE